MNWWLFQITKKYKCLFTLVSCYQTWADCIDTCVVLKNSDAPHFIYFSLFREGKRLAPFWWSHNAVMSLAFCHQSIDRARKPRLIVKTNTFPFPFKSMRHIWLTLEIWITNPGATISRKYQTHFFHLFRKSRKTVQFAFEYFYCFKFEYIQLA